MNSALLLCAHLFGPLLAGQVELEPAVVKLERRSGVELWTVRATQSSVPALLARVAELSGRTLDATSAVARAPLVTVALDRRPLDQVLEFALGSAGLLCEVEEHTIHVRADEAAEDTPDQRVAYASAAWARAAARHPAHPVAASARLAQGELEELRGRDESARARYLDVLAHDPASSSSGEAYLRAGRIAAARGDWSEASEHFRALANLPGAEEYRAVARVELARATLRLGDAPSALHILDALDLAQPCWEKTERTARTLVRVEALLAAKRFQDALLELEARAGDFDELGAAEVPELRARALEGAGLDDEASRAWLLVARGASASDAGKRSASYRSAARLAQASGDPLAVLFVAREARAAGFGALVAEAESAARASEGLADEPRVDSSAPLAERLAHAERRLAKHEPERAAAELEALYAERDTLAADLAQRARIALDWARSQEPRGIEVVVALVHAERVRLEDAGARRVLDLGLARLFEQRGLFERAADAYQGAY